MTLDIQDFGNLGAFISNKFQVLIAREVKVILAVDIRGTANSSSAKILLMS